MTETVVSELWTELKRYINTVDRAEAAETLVSVLIDHDSNVDDIANAFKGDRDIKAALTAYLDNDKSYEDQEEIEEEAEEDYLEDDWEN